MVSIGEIYTSLSLGIYEGNTLSFKPNSFSLSTGQHIALTQTHYKIDVITQRYLPQDVVEK